MPTSPLIAPLIAPTIAPAIAPTIAPTTALPTVVATSAATPAASTGAPAGAPAPRPAPTASRVEIVGVAFGPGLTIEAGSIVVWINRDSVAHDVAGMDGSWASALLPPGESYQRRFDQPGVVRYVCTLHALIMQSTLTVR